MVMTLKLNPDVRMLRQFGFLCAVVFGGIAGWKITAAGPGTVAIVLLLAAIAGGTLGWLRPAWLRPVYVGWMVLAFPIGWVVSHLLLALLFYAVFTPLGLLLRGLGKDPLQLKKPQGNSFWREKHAETDLRRYLRQY